ncbi:MAG TPA: glucose 1-dehydrogenase [Enhygromyxa sp.]|nr:glucose 1-dehydrogenase [Enhygromyxa sp.]
MKVVAITGAAQGIGRAIALHFASAGHAVSVADPAADAGAELLELVRELGVPALVRTTDVADAEAVSAWMDQTVDELGCPDVLVNNAGIMIRKPFLELPAEDFDRVIAVNLRGCFLCAQAAARAMVKHERRGAIINIASTRAFMSEPDTEGYTASKGGIVALTHGMAISLGAHGIRVNCISPGWIETRDWQGAGHATVPEHSDRDRDQHPVGRVGRPDDIARACLYLASAGFVTGQNLIIDGGMTVKMIYEE